MRLRRALIILAAGVSAGLLAYNYLPLQNKEEITVFGNDDAPDKSAATVASEKIKLSSPKFVGRQICVECHRKQQELWSGSHHDWAMRVATAETVLGDFDNALFDLHGDRWKFKKQGEQFIVNTVGPDGEIQDFRIKYTFGVAPLQQYLVELPRGRLQALTVAWDTRPAAAGGQRWFHLQAEEQPTKPDSPLHWSGRAYTWNNRCAECHSTNLEKKFDLSTDSYQTSWSEINVSCEACHGPGSSHVNWGRMADEQRKNAGNRNGLIVNYRENDAFYQIETCARCHSRRHSVSVQDGHGRAFLDDFMPATLQPGLYYPDGQIEDEVYVYGSFLQSKMYSRGVACTDCHDPHTARLKMQGNALCLQCHQSSPPLRRFPTLKAKNYDTPEHHFHLPTGEGAQCINCHMPAKTYMVVDPRHDHGFKIPRPGLSAKLGVPNACNNCHQDKSPRWAVTAIEKMYGPGPEVHNTTATIFAAAAQGDSGTIDSLAGLVGNPQTAGIVSATALTYLAGFLPDEEAVRTMIAALKNKDPLLRATAASGLDGIPLQYRLSLAGPLLDDPVRAVRIQAARVVAAIPASAFGDRQRAFETALEEYRALQHSLADTPEAHINLAIMYSEQNWPARAEQEYRRAIEIAPEFVPARLNLANLYNKMERNHDAEEQLRLAIQIVPEEGELYYSLGLLLAEQQRLEEVVILLEKATQLMPARVRVAYNYALTLQQLNQYDRAEAEYKRALGLSPQDADLIYAMVTLYAQQEQWQKALPLANRLVEQLNGGSGSRELLNKIRKKTDNVFNPARDNGP